MKRALDLLLVTLTFPFWGAAFACLLILVRLNVGQPTIFTQARTGLRGKTFRIVKFRTMNDFRDRNGELLTDSERMTRFGRFLRSTSLDELPELWNVIRGDMSLVGPRPLLEEYVSLYSSEQRRRHDVRPGITGWAQINGRNAVTWEEKFAMDVWYVDNQSLKLDAMILSRTFVEVLKRHGISATGEETATKFTGN